MKTTALRLVLFAVLFVFAAAWTKEDYEIFRLHDEVTAAEGLNVTFYDFLGTTASASQDELNKAYRKTSKLLHPDKVKRTFIANSSKDKSKSKTSKKSVHVNRGPTKREIDAAVKEAHERAQRLNTVATILRGAGRERYDHFLKNGFPTWRGTGYYYSRFRPGLGSVLVGLFLVFGGGGHYAALVLSWKRQRDFVDRYVRQARRAAWGDELGIRGIGSAPTPVPVPAADSGDAPPVPINRRQKRMMDRETRKEKKSAKTGTRNTGASTPPGETVEPTGERKRVVAENGKVLIVDSVGNVFLEEESEEGGRQEFLLDVEEIHRPTFSDTLIFKLPGWVYHKTVSRILGTFDTADDGAASEDEPVENVEELEQLSSAVASRSAASRKRGKRSQRA
ncbi:hypothetical protein BJX70DRAFT_46391 [Aspergillus crustosus]